MNTMETIYDMGVAREGTAVLLREAEAALAEPGTAETARVALAYISNILL